MPDVEQLRRVLRQAPGDALGVGIDPELSFAVALVAARRFMAGDHGEDALIEWRNVVDELVAQRVGGDAADATARRLAHQVLVRACEEWMAAGRVGTPTQHLTRELLGREEPDAPDRSVAAGAASILFTMAWGAAAVS